MKASRYNLFANAGASGAALLFNGGSAALAELDPGMIETVQRLLKDPSTAATPAEKELVEQLTYGRYLVPDNIDELDQIKIKNREKRLAGPTLFLTIAPTLACNFACDYCFESRSATIMSRETEDALLTFAKLRLARSKNMLITWFGGEPTLCMPTVERLQSALLETAAALGVTSEPASIITNGYLLDGALAARLAAVHIDEAQVTLDGPGRIHDTRRKLRNGGGTFDRIVANLRESSEAMRIVVRVNVDTTNIDSAWEIIDALDRVGVLSKVKVYFAPVNAADGICADMKGRCFTTEEFAGRQIALSLALMEKGFYQVDYPTLAPGSHCGADTDNSFVVAPNGLLFKCWEELSLAGDGSIGDLFQEAPEPHQQANLDRYLNWDPLSKSDCCDCSVLPLCMGGCPKQGLEMNDPTKGYCCSWKYNLGETLLLRYLCEQRKEVKS